MKIGINALFQASGGSLTNLAQLLREWHVAGETSRHRFVLFASPAADEGLRRMLAPDVLDAIEREILPLAARGLLQRLRAEQFQLPSRLRAHAIDVLFCPANVMPYRSDVPCVVAFQNAAPFCPSVTWRSLQHPGWWARFKLLGLFVRASAKRAKRVIFLSDWFRDLFVERFGFDPDCAEVIPIGAPEASALDDPELERSLGIRRPFLLYVSHLNPYKNILESIDAFLDDASRSERHQLVLVGMTNFPKYREAIERRITERGGGGRILLTGALPYRSVESLLAAADAFLFASTCESCSTALVEAMAYGLPVASSSTPPMPERAGDAAVYFDPFDVKEIARAINLVLNDEGVRSRLRKNARRRMSELAGEREVAERTLRVIERAVEDRR